MSLSLLFNLLLCVPCFAADPVPCDAKGGIWTFGLEYIADSCVPKDMTDTTVTTFTVNDLLVCDSATKIVKANQSVRSLVPNAAAIIQEAQTNYTNYRIFRNKEGTHIVLVHPNYVGTIDGKDMTAYAAGGVYTDVFKKGLILPTTPKCKKVPECYVCPCPEKELGSSANLNTGALSDSRELFTLKGGPAPLSLSLYYHSDPMPPSAIGNGWNHGYEQSLVKLANGNVTIWQNGKERDYRLNKDNVLVPSAGDYSTLTASVDGSYTLTEKDGQVSQFDSTGLLVSTADRNGNITSLSYTGGRLTGVTDPSGRTATFAYDTDGKLTSVTDPLTNSYTFTYTDGKLTRIDYPDGGHWDYSYGANGLISGKTNAIANLTTYSYDSNNRVTGSTDPQSQTRTVSYANSGSSRDPGKIPDPYPRCYQATLVNPSDPNRPIISSVDCEASITVPITEKNNGQWNYDYDYRSNTLKSKTDPYNNTTNYYHDNAGNMIAKTEAGIGTTYYTHDNAGNTISIRDPQGNLTSHTYNERGQVLTTSGPQGNSSNTYDTKGNLLTSTDPAGATTTYEYDAKGNVTKITNAKNQVTTMTYTAAGLLETSTDPAGLVTSYTYDANGNMLTTTTPDGTTTYVYDAANRITSITDPLNNVTSYTYDKQGNRISQTDANGNTTTYKYNYQGQVSESKDALNNVTTFNYSAANGGSCPSCTSGVDKLASLSDAKNQTTSYEYDLMSRLIKETDPLGKITTYAYDAAGNMISKTDANGVTITYSYDSAKRLTGKSYPRTNNEPDNSETYTYDAAGRMLTATNKDIGYTYSYDTGGRMSKVVDSRGYTLDYEYDILGTKTKTTLQKGTADEHIISYGYDTANRPSTITSKSGTFTYAYDTKGRRSSTAYPNGITATYGYDSLNRLTQIKQASGQTTIAFANYSGFDKIGNRKSKTTNTGTEQYSYDAIYRLTQNATSKGTENYSYDQVGNRLTGPGPKDTKYQYNAGNQQVVGKVYGHGYDNNGNQVSKTTTNSDKSWVYSWDYENRLVKSEQTKGTEQRIVTFRYDPQGRRIQKQLTTTIKGITQTTTWQYVYDGDNIALEIYTKPDGTTEKTWYTQGAGTDEHLALERTDQHYFYHADGLGSVTTITDAGKAVVQAYEYDSFGNTKSSTSFRNSYAYTGRENDQETGLYYYRARYYDQQDGRFVSKDPIGFKAKDMVLYGYVFNNSINKRDPSGLFCGSGASEALVPDSLGSLNFASACASHDFCYGTCGSCKATCDMNLYKDMLQECKKNLWNPIIFVECESIARLYFIAVTAFGGGPFNNAQKNCCKYGAKLK